LCGGACFGAWGAARLREEGDRRTCAEFRQERLLDAGDQGQEGRGEEEEEEEYETEDDGTEERKDLKEFQETTEEVRKNGDSSAEFAEALIEHELEMQQGRRKRFLQQRLVRRQTEAKEHRLRQSGGGRLTSPPKGEGDSSGRREGFSLNDGGGTFVVTLRLALATSVGSLLVTTTEIAIMMLGRSILILGFVMFALDSDASRLFMPVQSCSALRNLVKIRASRALD
jgi:hypothetical protein